MTVAESLKRFRAEYALSQKEVADTLGKPASSYYRYEIGRFIPQADDIIKLATTYNVSADYLLGLSDAPINPTVTNTDSELVEAVIACHKALQDVFEKRRSKANAHLQNHQHP